MVLVDVATRSRSAIQDSNSLAVQPLTPTLSPEYRGEGVRRGAHHGPTNHPGNSAYVSHHLFGSHGLRCGLAGRPRERTDHAGEVHVDGRLRCADQTRRREADGTVGQGNTVAG